MKVEFLGFKEQGKTGCVPCGRRKVSTTFKREKKVVLPSGRTIFFIYGRAEEVSKDDGEFLLELTYSLNGKEVNMFKEVD